MIAVITGLAHIANAVTAGGSHAVQTAGSRRCITVGRTIIALLPEVDVSIAAQAGWLTGGSTCISIDEISIVAALSGVYDAITAGRHRAIETARVRLGIAITRAVIACFERGKYHTIPADNALDTGVIFFAGCARVSSREK